MRPWGLGFLPSYVLRESRLIHRIFMPLLSIITISYGEILGILQQRWLIIKGSFRK